MNKERFRNFWGELRQELKSLAWARKVDVPHVGSIIVILTINSDANGGRISLLGGSEGHGAFYDLDLSIDVLSRLEESIFEYEDVRDYAHAFLKAMSGPKTLVLGKGEEGSMKMEVILEEGSGDLVIRRVHGGVSSQLLRVIEPFFAFGKDGIAAMPEASFLADMKGEPHKAGGDGSDGSVEAGGDKNAAKPREVYKHKKRRIGGSITFKGASP